MSEQIIGNCVALWGDIHGSVVLVSREDGTCRVVSLQNVPIGPRLSVRIDSSDHAVFPGQSTVVISNYVQGRVTCCDASTAKEQWSRGSYRNIMGLYAAASGSLFIRQYDGTCTRLDAQSGDIVSTIKNVVSVVADTQSELIAFERGSLKQSSRVIELRNLTNDRVRGSLSLPMDNIAIGAIGEEWIAITSHDTGQIWGLSHDGQVLWTDQYRLQSYCSSLCRQPEPDRVLAVVVSRVREHPPTAILFEARTGRRLSVREFKRGGDVPVAQGRYLAWNEGLLCVETLGITPVKWTC